MPDRLLRGHGRKCRGDRRRRKSHLSAALIRGRLADDVMILFWRDYHVVTVSDDCRSAWRWEIRRRRRADGRQVERRRVFVAEGRRGSGKAGAREIPDRAHLGGAALMTAAGRR